MKVRRLLLLSFIAFFAASGAWFLWSPWPDPVPVSLRWRPDAIVILGGGREDRARQGKMLSDIYSDVPVIVTGDGDVIFQNLRDMGLGSDRIIHEKAASSTIENALLTIPILDRMKANRVVLVTTWFHVPRALAVFRHEQPKREFAASFETKPVALTRWDKDAQRRERFAAVQYFLRYGVWSW